MPNVTIYTDGSFKKSYNAGGWSCMLVCDGQWKIIADNTPNTTINREELTAVIAGLQQLTCPCDVTIISDSQYTVNCINKWIKAWSLNGWITRNRTPVINQDLLLMIQQFKQIHNIKATWIKAHTKRKGINYIGNSVVDRFAQYGSEGLV